MDLSEELSKKGADIAGIAKKVINKAARKAMKKLKGFKNKACAKAKKKK